MSDAEQFVGTWQLVSQHTVFLDGQAEPSRGEGALGVLMYDAHGNMAVQLTRSDARAADFTDMSSFEHAMEGYLGYFGRYEVDEQQGVIRHRVIGASYVGYRGSIQRRFYHFHGDKLTLKGINPADGTTRVLVWKRITTREP
jgi:hypothetical protein